MIPPRRQRKASRVLNILPLHLLRRIQRQLHRLSHIAHRNALRVLHLPHNVETRLIAVPALHKRNLRARNNQTHRNKERVPALPEVQRLQIHRHIRRREIAAHLFRQRQFAVLGLLMLEVRRRIVARPVFDLHIAAIHLDRQVAKRSIACLVGRVEAENVIRLGVMLHLLKRRRKIIRVEERLTARVGAQRAQRLLRSKVRAQLRGRRSAAIRRVAAQASLARIPHRSQRLQPARIHAIDREIRLRRLIGCRTQARLVLDAIACQPTGEVQHRLALVHSLQALRDRADRQQFAVRIQAVVLRIVRRKRSRIVARPIRRAGRSIRKPGLIAAVILRQAAQQRTLV